MTAPSTPDLAARVLAAIGDREQLLQLGRPRVIVNPRLRPERHRCELDRHLVERHQPEEAAEGRLPGFCKHCGWRWPCPDLRDLAEVYGITEEG